MVVYCAYSDQQLVDLLGKGDSYAYTEIYNRYKTLLYIFALRRMDDREEAKDLIHELFLSIWSKREDLILTSSLGSYLYTAVRNRIIDNINRKQVSARYIESFQQYIDSGEGSTDHLIRSKELSALIEKEIEDLPVKMRQVFELRRKTDYSRKQIADELGLSEQTVKSHIQHALKILKVKLGPMLMLLSFWFLRSL
jgi:RNA polymerase sigma-70 factor (ECF subfamily)